MNHMKLYKRGKYLKKIRGFYHDTDIIKVISVLIPLQRFEVSA